MRIPTPKSTPQKDSELVEETALRGVCVEAPGTGPTKHDKTLVQKDAGLHSSLKEVFKTTSTVQESNKREPKTLESVKESTNPTMKQEDDELDFLLSVSTPAEHSQAQGNVSAQQAKVCSTVLLGGRELDKCHNRIVCLFLFFFFGGGGGEWEGWDLCH